MLFQKYRNPSRHLLPRANQAQRGAEQLEGSQQWLGTERLRWSMLVSYAYVRVLVDSLVS
jgi:hypothetical protein